VYLTMRDSADLFYTCTSPAENTAETILFIHGLGLDQTTWDWMVPYFQSRYRVVRYDLRGHGNSGMGTAELNWDLLCQDLFQLISHLNIEKVHLVGHALGGNLCLQFALRYPSMVQSIVMIGTACYYPQGIIEKHIEIRRRLADQHSILPLAQELVKKICYPVDHGKQELLLQAYQKVTNATYFSYLHLTASILNSQLVSCVQTPVLLLSGQNDPIYPPSVLVIGASLLPRSQFLVVPSASNAIQLDQPKLAAEWIEQFFGQLEQKHSGELSSSDDWTASLKGELVNQIRQVIMHGYKRVGTVNELRIELLHTFRVLINGEEVPGSWNQRHAKEIIAYLAVHKIATREQLCDLFWLDLHIDKAKNNLRVALSHLKSLLQKNPPGSQEREPFLYVDREHIRLQGRVSCDLVELKETLDQIEHEPDPGIKLTFAKKLLSDLPPALLAGFYDDWVLEIREQLENRIVELCKWVADCCEQQEAYAEGITYLNIALRYHPNNAEIYERILELYKRNKMSILA
jgi:pimeloyl-ACP methyl ester carboxylesterase/DNA-binding SARP family transcriptional activator